MKNRCKLFSIFLILSLSLLFSGCGFAKLDLTEEEIDRIVNYSANLLEKYNSHQKGTLADVSDTSLAVLLEEEDIQKREEARKAAEKEKRKQEQENKEAQGEGEGSGEVGDSGNPLIDSNASEFTDPAALLGLEGFRIDYTGFDITDTYPESSSEEDLMFGITSGSGDSLLVMHFDITNTGAEPAHCSILQKDPSFKIKVNGDRHSLLKTLLMDDLATFDEDMEPGAVAKTVLVAEISSAKAAAIDSIVLTLKNENGDNQMILETGVGGVSVPVSEGEEAEALADGEASEEARPSEEDAPAEEGASTGDLPETMPEDNAEGSPSLVPVENAQ